MTADGRDPFAVDQDRALDALTLAWAGEYPEIWVRGSEWGAHHKDAGDDDVITGSTPDELNRAIRADWSWREQGGTAQAVQPPLERGDSDRSHHTGYQGA